MWRNGSLQRNHRQAGVVPLTNNEQGKSRAGSSAETPKRREIVGTGGVHCFDELRLRFGMVTSRSDSPRARAAP